MLRKSILLCFGFLLCFNMTQGMDIETGFEPIKDILIRLKHFGKRTTSIEQRRFYGYNGQLTPIVESPRIYRSGFIIENAQPSMWWGLWYDYNQTPKDLIFVVDEDSLDLKYQACIKPRTGISTTLWSSCLITDGSRDIMGYHLAVLWESLNKFYITKARLNEIQSQNNIFDLDSGKVEVNLRSERNK